MSTSPADFNAKIIEEFHANEGRVGGMFESMPLLLLHHTGAKTGQARINPLVYQADDGRYVIFASKAGAPSHPDWYHNLKANPNVSIEVGTETIPCSPMRPRALSATVYSRPRSRTRPSSPNTSRALRVA